MLLGAFHVLHPCFPMIQLIWSHATHDQNLVNKVIDFNLS